MKRVLVSAVLDRIIWQFSLAPNGVFRLPTRDGHTDNRACNDPQPNLTLTALNYKLSSDPQFE